MNEGFPEGSVSQESASVGDTSSIPESGRYPEEGNGNPLQYSCLENPMDRGAWGATVHGVTKSRTGLSDFHFHLCFLGGSVGKESTCHAGDPDLIPGSGRSPGEGNGNPLQYSCLENPMDRGAWQDIVHGVTKSQTQLSIHTYPTCVWEVVIKVLSILRKKCLQLIKGHDGGTLLDSPFLHLLFSIFLLVSLVKFTCS